ncbi:hypothetical protein DY000_02059298 [Brassica cretica]|uniref:Uncharacterized protein n=1 Tax=Brassica cretica TaxID=69181 RepID=A0ABQ7B2V2_BRACR|nr:hypothetical protein DY000_02059298 [Brassica cretica]
MYMSKAAQLDVPKHQRPPIWTEEAVGLHKRVKRIHDHVKIVVPCAVFEAGSPIPPDRSMKFSSYIEVLDDHQHVEASHKRLRFRDEVNKGPAEAASIDTDQIPSNDTNKPASIDIICSPSIDTRRISELKESDVCGNLRGGETTTRSDKSGGKKRRNWKKRKRIMGHSQLSLIPRFSDGVRKSRISKVKQNDYNKALSGRQPTVSNRTVASSDTVARTSTDTVAKNQKLRKRSEEDEFAEGSTMAAQHRSTEHHKYRSPLNCVDRHSHQWQPSTDETISLSVDSTS